MTIQSLSRRSFLKTTGQVALTTSLIGAGGLMTTPEAKAATSKGLKVQKQKKTLVFIMLDGGNDSFNMLVPREGRPYQNYKRSRGHLALGKNQLLSLKSRSGSHPALGLHPNLGGVQKLFNNKKLSFVANVGPLIEPVSKDTFLNNAVKLPVGLMSHADQFKHWQTARPGERLNQGWFLPKAR